MPTFKRLSIHKETLSLLSSSAMEKVAGGNPTHIECTETTGTGGTTGTGLNTINCPPPPCTKQRTGCHTVSFGPC